MGAEAKATLRVGAERHVVTALLESDAVIVRGPHRLRIALAQLTDSSVTGDTLRLVHPDGTTELELGAKVASAWLEKIRNPRTLADKLGVRAGMRVALVGFPGDDEPIRAELASRGASVVDDTVPEETPMVLLRATSPAELEELRSLAGRIARNGAIWVVHRRGDSSVADTVVFAAAMEAGLVATKVARFSDTESAEKLVIPVAAR